MREQKSRDLLGHDEPRLEGADARPALVSPDGDNQPARGNRSSRNATSTAYAASSRVESSAGSGELPSLMMSGISVQPRMTHSAPLLFRPSMALMNRSVVAGS